MIFLLITFITLLMALMMTFYQSTRKTCPGFLHWFAGTWVITFGCFFLFLRGVLPDIISILGVNTSFPIGFVCILQGMQIFLEQKKYRNWIYIFPLFTALAGIYFYNVYNEGGLRILFLSISVAIPNALIAVGMHKSPGKNRSAFFYLVIASVIALNSIFLLLRALIILLEPSFKALEPTPIQFYFMAAVIQIAAFIRFILLNSERLESDLKHTEQHLQESIRNLQKALNEVKTLGALLPICAQGIKIRNVEDCRPQ